jgi:hypothetical protein
MVVIYVRIYSSEYQILPEEAPLLSQSVMQTADDIESKQETVVTPQLQASSGSTLHVDERSPIIEDNKQFLTAGIDMISPQFSALGARNLVDIGAVAASHAEIAANGASMLGSSPSCTMGTGQNSMSKERMAAIAAQLEHSSV